MQLSIVQREKSFERSYEGESLDLILHVCVRLRIMAFPYFCFCNNRCYFSPLMACDEASLSSISFPALSCGVGGVDPHTSARMMFAAINEYLKQPSINMSIHSIYCCLLEKKNYDVWNKLAESVFEKSGA